MAAIKEYRFDARLTEEQKTLIQRAAELDGRTRTDFVLHSAEVAAQRTLEERSVLVLTARESEAFVEALMDPAPPSQGLVRAAKRYERAIGLE